MIGTGISLGITALRGGRRGSGGGFDPAALLPAAWYDPSDLSTLFQDSAATIAVTSPGQPVGCMLDRSGNGRHMVQKTGSARPVLQTDGQRHWLDLDGINDALTCAIAPGDTPLTLVAGWEWRGDGAGSLGYEGILAAYSGNSYSRALHCGPAGEGEQLVGALSGSTVAQITVASGPLVLRGRFASVAGGFGIRASGAQADAVSNSAAALPNTLAIGRGRGYSERAMGRFFGGLVWFSDLPTPDAVAVETWLASRTRP